jgi:hypothetical protein
LRLASAPEPSSGRSATSGKKMPTSALSVERKRSTSRWKMSHTTCQAVQVNSRTQKLCSIDKGISKIVCTHETNPAISRLRD